MIRSDRWDTCPSGRAGGVGAVGPEGGAGLRGRERAVKTSTKQWWAAIAMGGPRRSIGPLLSSVDAPRRDSNTWPLNHKAAERAVKHPGEKGWGRKTPLTRQPRHCLPSRPSQAVLPVVTCHQKHRGAWVPATAVPAVQQAASRTVPCGPFGTSKPRPTRDHRLRPAFPPKQHPSPHPGTSVQSAGDMHGSHRTTCTEHASPFLASRICWEDGSNGAGEAVTDAGRCGGGVCAAMQWWADGMAWGPLVAWQRCSQGGPGRGAGPMARVGM